MNISRFVFILGFAVGVVTWIRGTSGGLGVIVGSIAGLGVVHFDQKLAQVSWPWFVGIALIVIGVGFFIYRDRIGKSAFKGVIKKKILTKAETKLVRKVEGKE